MTTHTVTAAPRKPARAAGPNTALGGSGRPGREMCWADHPITELNFHLGLCPGHLEEIFGITADGCGQGLGRVP